MTLDEAISIGNEAGKLLDAENAKGNELLTATEAVDRIVAQRARRISTAAAPARVTRQSASGIDWADFNRRVNEDWATKEARRLGT